MISVCMATYDGGKYIKEQIKSILLQLGDEDELVISDDHSSDNTLEIISSFNDERIHIVEGPAKGHPRYNFENGLKHCKGDYIFLCDQDDIWMPNKVEVFCRYLQNNDLVVSDCYIIDADGEVIRESFFNGNLNHRKGFFKNLIGNHYLGCCMAFNRKLLDTILPFPSQIAQHDIWIGLCAEILSMNISFIPDKLMKYRRYDGNFSYNGFSGGSKNSISYRILYRLYFLVYSVLRYIRTKRNCKTI